MSRVYDLEDRLIKFAVSILSLTDGLPKKGGAMILANQLMRSGTSPALNYGEAQAAESPKDFLHKIKICLKELRESQVCLKIIKLRPYLKSEDVDPILNECGELVAIFVQSVKTARRKNA